MVANFCQKLYFADSFGHKNYSFLERQYEQMMPAPLQSHPSVCGFYTLYGAFHLLKFRQEELRGLRDVNALSFISIYKKFFNFPYVNVKVIQGLCQYLYKLINVFNFNTIFLHSIESYQYK